MNTDQMTTNIDSAGRVAVLAWLGCGAVIIWTNEAVPFVSLVAAAYFTVGTLFAGTLLGGFYFHARSAVFSLLSGVLNGSSLRAMWAVASVVLFSGLVYVTFLLSSYSLSKLDGWIGSDPSSRGTFSAGVLYCANPIPQFTLDADAQLSNDQADRLCACVWEGLSSEVRDFFVLAEHDTSAGAGMTLKQANMITEQFRGAISGCGVPVP